MQKVVLIALAMLALPGAVMADQKKRIVCWEDENGRRMCGDRIPQQYAKKERKVYDDKGYVVDIKAREKTPEELEAEKNMAALAKQAKERAELQAAYDAFLLQTYTSAAALEIARDKELQTADYRTQLAEKVVEKNRATLAALEGEVKAAADKGGKPDAALQKKVKAAAKALADSEKGLVSQRAERVKVAENFNRDIERFRQLTEKDQPMPAPAPASAPPN